MLSQIRLRVINQPTVMCEVLGCGVPAEFWIECEAVGYESDIHPMAACCRKHAKEGERGLEQIKLPPRRKTTSRAAQVSATCA